MAAANASGASTGVKWPAPARCRTWTALKNSPSRSDQAGGNSGACSGPRGGVHPGQVVEAPVVGLERRPRPVGPEVAQVGPDGLGAAVEQLLDQPEAVERLGPETPPGP